MKSLKMTFAILMGMAIMLAVFAGPVSAQADRQHQPQNMQNQQMMQQQHMKDMNAMMEKMSLLVDRMHALHQKVELQLQTDQQAANAPMLRHLQDLNTSLATFGENLKATMANYNELRTDENAAKNAQFNSDMSSFKEQLKTLSLETSKSDRSHVVL